MGAHRLTDPPQRTGIDLRALDDISLTVVAVDRIEQWRSAIDAGDYLAASRLEDAVAEVQREGERRMVLMRAQHEALALFLRGATS